VLPAVLLRFFEAENHQTEILSWLIYRWFNYKAGRGHRDRLPEGDRVENATAVIWKTLLVAKQRLRRLDAPECLPEVAEGIVYVGGVRKKRNNAKAAA